MYKQILPSGLSLRGVSAAAVDITTSMCGELIQFARLGIGAAFEILSFPHNHDVLYVLVSPCTDLPESMVQLR